MSQVSTWTTSEPHNKSEPLLVSSRCYDSLVTFFRNSSSELLAVTAESQSRSSGLHSLFAQPWIYAGGGLGNMNECPLQVCLAGGTSRYSTVFASACVVPECNAFDLAAEDFPSRLEVASFQASPRKGTDFIRLADGTNYTVTKHDESIIKEYVSSHERYAELNKFLNTGWVCGEYKPKWEIGSTLYLGLLLGFTLISFLGTFVYNKRKNVVVSNIKGEDDDDEEKKDERKPREIINKEIKRNVFWTAWDIREHLKKLCSNRRETAALDGLKFWSLSIIIFGHVIAIESSVAPGYLNNDGVEPPNGALATFWGQLEFASRFAVDTFLCIGGYLVVYTLKRKLTERTRLSTILLLFLGRTLRILPLYGMCIGFWMLMAPHMGSGPFWYNWQFQLQPCQDYWWTNFLFVNNFIPWDRPTTDSCFYHSWYLAVDMQLFVLFGPWLVILYLRSHQTGRRVTAFLWCLSVFLTAVLTYNRDWSIHSGDGKFTGRYDTEGYAKPHVRASSYLAGMLVAMVPRRSRAQSSYDNRSMIIALSGIVFLMFITVTGANSRRFCLFTEDPISNDCGSSWSPTINFLYSAFSRALWSICIAVIMHLCVNQRGGPVGSFLSWGIWTPLAHLSYGAYLIHPMILFIWKLGDNQKMTFRWFSQFMTWNATTVVSLICSCLAALVIELPCGSLLQYLMKRKRREEEEEDSIRRRERTIIESVPLTVHNPSYGATNL